MRILHITEVLEAAGIESFIMNVYRNIDRSKVQFDFLVMRNQPEFYDDEIAKLGGKKYTISVPISNTLLRVQLESIQLYRFLKKHKYKVVHIHTTTPLRAPYLLAAKMAGVKTRIYHSHSAEVSGKSKFKLATYNLYRKKISSWATEFFACSRVAAEWIFESNLIESGKATVIYNGIDIEKFKFNEQPRVEYRTLLNLKNDFVIVHTGRFLEQKNQSFVVDVFNELLKTMPDSKLLFLGKGPLLDSVANKVRNLNLGDRVVFLGVRDDVNKILCASDLFIMPSLYEGLPVAAVEAQCSDLPCLFSTNITEEVALTERTSFLSLDASLLDWVNCIKELKTEERHDISSLICQKGYSMSNGVKKLQEFYLSKNQ